MTVNNCSNMNKANNHIVPQLIEHRKTHRMNLEFQSLTLNRHTNLAMLNRFVFIKTYIKSTDNLFLAKS